MAKKFNEMSAQEREEEFLKYVAKRTEKSIVGPAKREAVQRLISENREEYAAILKEEVAKAPKRTYTEDQLAEKLEKYRERLIKKGPANTGKRAAIKKLITLHKADHEAIQAECVARARGVAPKKQKK